MCQLDFGFVVRLHTYGLLFESTNIVSKQLQAPVLVMARALPLVRSQIERVRKFPSRFNELWDDAVTSLSTLQQTDLINAASLMRQTRSNKQSIQKEKIHTEFVNACNTVADDMETRFGGSDHDIIVQGCKHSFRVLTRCSTEKWCHSRSYFVS